MHTITLVSGEDRLALCGAGTQPPFCAARLLEDASAAGERVSSTLELALEHLDPAVLAAAVNRLETLLRASAGSGERLFLACRRLADGPEWRARVISASLARTGGSAESGSLGLALRLEREAAWRGAETQLELNNLHGEGASARQVDNHSDSLHSAMVEIPARSVSGDLPALLRLRLTNSDAGEQPVGRVWVGLAAYESTPGYATVWEAEYGAGGEARFDAPASGSYRRLSWSGADPAAIWSYTLAQNEIPAHGGWTFALLARLVAAAPDGAWLKLRLLAEDSGALLDETPWSAVEAGALQSPLGALRIPPFQLPAGVSSALLRAELLAWVDSSGSHALDLDFIALLGQDGLRRYDALAPLPAGWSLEDDGGREWCGSSAGGAVLATHAPVGAALMLIPGQINRLTILHEVIGAGINDHSLTVEAWATPRKRII